MRNYQLRVQVILNPKTPINIALNALPSLRPPDLKSVARSHGVPAIVSTRAKEIIKKRIG